MVRNITSENINIQRTLLALLALVLAGVLFAVWPNPADAATIFTVNKTGDAGDRKITDTVCDSSRLRGKQCTLRAAIEEANDTSGADTINFAIGGTAWVKTILPDSELPEITDPVTIDGYSQRGAKANTLAEGKNAVLKMEINGGRAEPPVAGLVIRTSNSTIKGLVINHFNGPGVLISDSDATATDNKIEGNFLGTRPDGSTGFGNSTGVAISGASNNTISGTASEARNLISSNNGGVDIFGFGATDNKVEGNYIGTDKTGSDKLENLFFGVRIGSVFSDGVSNNTIGGATTGARNVISGNDGSGPGSSGETITALGGKCCLLPISGARKANRPESLYDHDR